MYEDRLVAYTNSKKNLLFGIIGLKNGQFNKIK